MVFDLFSCSFDTLNSLKFNELQKLAAQFQVNKRWAKKREIIEKLLLLRDQELGKRNSPDKSTDKTEWIDGNQALNIAENTNTISEEGNRRLTYNINNSVEQASSDRRLTFIVGKKNNDNGSALNNLPNIPEVIDRRLTYNADELKRNLNSKINTYDAQIIETKPDDSNIAKTEDKNENDQKIQPNNHKSKIKQLTIPYSGRLGQTKNKPPIKDSKIKLPEKISLMGTSKKPVEYDNKKTKLTVPLSEVDLKLIDSKQNLTKNKNLLQRGVIKTEISNLDKKNGLRLENGRPSVQRRKSKTEDNVLVKNLKETSNLKFFTPKQGMRIQRRHSDTPQALESKIPRFKSGVSTQKPITATKMPDFSKIHKKQFEQMDSLHDYMRKKEERAKKLFGLPQPGIPTKVNKDVFQFKSTINEKENKISKQIGKSIPSSIKNMKEKPNRKDIFNRPGLKSNIVSNLKEENRKHMNGVRTNKRFELLMKHRNL